MTSFEQMLKEQKKITQQLNKQLKESQKKVKQLQKTHSKTKKAKVNKQGRELQKKLNSFAKHEDSVINPVTKRPVKLAGKSFVTHGKKGNVKFTEYKSPFNLKSEYHNLQKWFKDTGNKLPKQQSIMNLLDRKIEIEDKSEGTNTFTVIGNVKFKQPDGSVVPAPIRVNKDAKKKNQLVLPKGIDRRTAQLYIAVLADKFTDAYGTLESYDTLVLDPVHTTLAKQKMKGVRFQCKLLEGVSVGVKQRDGWCTVDYLWHELEGKNRFKNMTVKKLINELSDFCVPKEGVSTEDIINWKLKYHNNISVYALNPMKEVFLSSPATDEKQQVILTFMVADGHLHPITKENTKRFISKAKRLQENDVKMEEFRFDVRFSGEKFNLLTDDNMDEFIRGETTEKIYILANDGKDKKDAKSLVSLTNDCMIHTDYLVDQMDFSNLSTLNAFQHPTSNQIAVEGFEFTRRQNLCKTLFDIYQVDCFRFVNQSLTQIARDAFRIVSGYFKASTYTEEARKMLDDYKPNSLVETIETGDMLQMDIHGLDTKKAYSSVLLNNVHDIPIFSINNTVEEYKGDKLVCGLYYIENTKLIRYTNKDQALTLKPAFYSWNLVQYLLDNKHITKESIKCCIKASFSMDADTFRPFVEFCYAHLEMKDAKDIVNMLIGFLGKSHNKTYKGCVTDSAETLCCLLSDMQDAGETPMVSMFEHLFVIRKEVQTRLEKDNVSIWNHVVSAGIMNLLRSCERVVKQGGTVVGVNTDCVFYRGCDAITDVIGKDETLNIGLAVYENSKPKMFHNYENKEELDVTKYMPVKGTGVIYTGIAGCGKTQKLLDTFKNLPADSFLVLAPSNKACVNINERYNQDVKICNTPNSKLFLSSSEKDKIKMLNKTLLIDEFTMLNDYWMSLIYRAWCVNKNKIYLFGDPYQCNAVEDEINPINHIESVGVLQMCPNVVELEYIEATGRYTLKYKNELDIFRETGKTDHMKFKKPDISLKVNIVKTNAKRKEITKHHCQSGIKIEFTYQKKKEIYPISELTPLLCTRNMKDKGMVTNQFVNVQSIDNSTVVVKDKEFSHEEFGKSFIVAYAYTVQKSQGGTINEPFNIWEPKDMEKNGLYTALGRSTHEDYVHCAGYKSYYKPLKYTCQPLKKYENEFDNGIIYLVEFDDGFMYVGETIMTVQQRLAEHKRDTKSVVFKHIAETGSKCTIREIAKVPSRDHTELMKYETYYIQLYEKEHGSKLLNKKQLRRKEVVKEDKVDISIKTSISDKRFQITNYEKNNELRIQYRDENGKMKKVSKKYTEATFDDAMVYMKKKREGILIDLAGL